MGRTHDLFFELSNKHRVNILRTLAEKPGSITAVRAPEFIDRIHRHKKIPGPRHRGTLSVQAKDG